MIRKSEADALPPFLAKSQDGHRFVAHARRFYCSKGYDILNVDVTNYDAVVARYFADPVTGEHKGYLAGEPWKKIKLINLIQKAAGLRQVTNTYSWYYNYETARWGWDYSKDVVRKVLPQSLDYWENEQESELYYKRAERRWEKLQERVQATMRPVPEGFREWAEKVMHEPLAVEETLKCAIDTHCYRCTECGKIHIRGKAYRANRTIECPHCGAQIRVQGKGETKRGLYIFQICANNPGAYYERYIHAWKEWQDGKWSLFMEDVALGIVEGLERFGEVLYWEGDGYGRSSHNGRLPTFGEGYIFPDMGGADKLMTAQQSRCLNALIVKGYKADANSVVMHSNEPGMEYLIKGGYERFARDVIRKKYADPFGEDTNAMSIAEYLGISKQQCLRLKQINGSFKEWGWLRYEKVTGKKVSQQDMEFFTKHGIDCNDTERGTRMMLSFIPSPTAFRNYLEKQKRLSGESISWVIDTYNDYIRMARKQGLNLSSEIFCKPKNLKAAHDGCVLVAHEKEFEKAAKKIEDRFPEIPGILAEIRDKYSYASGDYTIVVPETISDILKEGRALGHCVDTTDRYFERIQQHVTYLVFLRHASDPRMSWYTLEIEPGGTVRQQRTTGNRQNKEDTEAYMPFIKEWQKEVRKRISEKDREMAAKSRSIRIAEYKELREKKETVRRGLLTGKLLVDVLEADLVEAI